MSEESSSRTAAYKFIFERIDSVPQLEALLLLWTSRPRVWSTTEVAARLYVPLDTAKAILQDLARQQLICCTYEEEWEYCYSSDSERDTVVEAVAETYQTEMVPISTMIHSKASRAVRDFARAFRFTKEPE